MSKASGVLVTERLRVELIRSKHAKALFKYTRRNVEHFAPWDPVGSPRTRTIDYWKRFAKVAKRDVKDDRVYRFVVFDAGDAKKIIGMVSLFNVVRGAFLACHLGYSVDGEFEGRGIATEAVSAVLAFAFDELRLHRVMANYMPANERSARLLMRLGFSIEGKAREYLAIGGAWQDMVLTAKVNPDIVAGGTVAVRTISTGRIRFQEHRRRSK